MFNNCCMHCEYGEYRVNKTGTFKEYYCHLFAECVDYEIGDATDIRCDFFEPIQTLDDNETEESRP